MAQDKQKLSGITRDELIRWGGVSAFNQALPFVNSGSVSDVQYNSETGELKGKIALSGLSSGGWAMPVSLVRQRPGTIKSNCPCKGNVMYGQICPHVVALGLALLLQEMEDEALKKDPPPSQKRKTKTESEENDEKYFALPARPKISAFVSGSRASLSVEIDAHYGQIEFPACSRQAPKTVWLEDPEDPLVRRTRSMEAEREAIDYIRKWGFTPGYSEGDVKFYVTNPHKVLNFLGKGIPALRRLGWRVDLSDRLMKLTDTMPYVVPVVTIKDAPGGDFDVRYEFDAMGTFVSPVEIQAAINRDDAFLRGKDGKVILVDIDAIVEMHSVFKDCALKQGDAAPGWFRVDKIHAPYVKSSLEKLDVEVDFEEAGLWRETARSFGREDGDDNAKFEPVALGRFDGILRPYQKQGVYWMRFMENAGYCGILADEMGLGKTVQTLAWLSLPRSSPMPALIVAPTSLIWNWAAEAKKFAPSMKVLVVDKAQPKSLAKTFANYDLVITSYPRLHRDIDDLYFAREFGAIVLDEAQRIKNHTTKTSRSVKLLMSKKRLVLTGTPIENSVTDVWSIFDFLMPGYLGDFNSFKEEYALAVQEGGAFGEAALAKLQRKLRPFILRRLKKTVAKDLPDKIVKVFWTPLDEKGETEYRALLAKTRHEVGSLVKSRGFDASRLEILARLTKLRQTASRGKMGAFLGELEDAIAGGHRVLVFSQFVSTLKAISKELTKRDIKFCYLDGQTKNRLEQCNLFNRDRSIGVFLISLMAGGTGLNLIGADMVIHYDPWWNPAVEDQATDRAHRIGQTKNVYVVKMIASHTIEEKVLELQRRKQAVIAATVSASDAAVMSRLTAEDIGELLSGD